MGGQMAPDNAVIYSGVEDRGMAEGDIDELLSEVLGQPSVLASMERSSLSEAPPGSVFVGAGDSYAAALAGFYSSLGRAIALDPYTLAMDPSAAEGAEVFFISVSGKTASNLAATKRVAGLAGRTTSITAAEDSPLARATDRTIRLPMRYRPRRPGLLSFCLSLMAVLKLTGYPTACDFGRALKVAQLDYHSASFGRGTTYFLGNSLAHPVAIYGAAKAYEILGTKAHAEILEEFSHMELLSLSKQDSVNALASFDAAGAARKLVRVLHGQGYDARTVGGGGRAPTEALFSSVFAVQLSVLRRAKRKGLAKPSFLGLGGRLRASDAMIY